MQGDIFKSLTLPITSRDGEVGETMAAFAELCMALYEREISQLAQQPATSVAGLQRRLKSTPYYVQNAARGMLENELPLQLDLQNASWHAPQKAKLARTAAQPRKLYRWLSKDARLGDAVPIYVITPHLKQVRLDSIDDIDQAQQRVHCNQFGWFDFNGDALEADDLTLYLVKPEKTTLGAALAGHQWNHRGRIDPRTLSLREVLLATTITLS